MRRIHLIIGVMVLVAAIASGCSEGKSGSTDAAAAPEGNAAATVVIPRGDLIAALWSEADEAPAEASDEAPAEAPEEAPAEGETADGSDAGCLAASSFVVEGTTGFLIQKNPAPTETNTTPVVIVGPINLVVADGSNRSALCGAGEKAYIVTASAELPIDIELSAEAAAKGSLESIAKDEPTPYPDTCNIQAHFERHGGEPCEEAADEGASPDEAHADGPSVALNREEDAPPPQPVAEEEPAADQPPAEDESPAAEGCGGPAAQTFKLVVESVNCVTNTFVGQPGA